MTESLYPETYVQKSTPKSCYKEGLLDVERVKIERLNFSQYLEKPFRPLSSLLKNRPKPFLIWFTGLSGSGKSTLAELTTKFLLENGCKVYLLDGDKIRSGLNKDLGFSLADRAENLRRTAEVAKLMLDAGLVVIAAFISPFQKERDMVRQLVGSDNYLEVYLECPLSVCEKRDVKGLYKKVRSGEISSFTGIDSPYEIPVNPDLVLKTAEEDMTRSLEKITSSLTSKFL